MRMTVHEEMAAHALPTARQVIVRSIGRDGGFA